LYHARASTQLLLDRKRHLDELKRVKDQHFLWRNASTIEREQTSIDEDDDEIEIENEVLHNNRERQGGG
jgi:hypothetical protein